jgi:hypothetical protein
MPEISYTSYTPYTFYTLLKASDVSLTGLLWVDDRGLLYALYALYVLYVAKGFWCVSYRPLVGPLCVRAVDDRGLLSIHKRAHIIGEHILS